MNLEGQSGATLPSRCDKIQRIILYKAIDEGSVQEKAFAFMACIKSFRRLDHEHFGQLLENYKDLFHAQII